jgi:CheY-like chemotaxis protein
VSYFAWGEPGFWHGVLTQVAEILVIDDDPLIRDMLSTELADAGHSVTAAANGWEGMRRFRPDFHDLVITDICMPQVNGADLLRVLRREVPEVPVVVISAHAVLEQGNSSAWTRELMTELGASRVLSKPFSRHELLAAISDLLAARRPVPSEGGNKT